MPTIVFLSRFDGESVAQFGVAVVDTCGYAGDFVGGEAAYRPWI